MAAKITWNGDQLKARLQAGMARNLDAARIDLANYLKIKVGIDGTAKVATVKVDSKGRKRKGSRLAYGAHPSKPGEPPRKQTGRGQSDIASERNGLIARVGTNNRYMAALELVGPHGNGQIRPWLRSGFYERQAVTRALIEKPIL